MQPTILPTVPCPILKEVALQKALLLLCRFGMRLICRYEMHIGNIKLLDYYGGYNAVTPEAYFAAWLVLEEMKSDPCWKFPHRFYCVEDRFEVKKQQSKRSLAHRRPEMKAQS